MKQFLTFVLFNLTIGYAQHQELSDKADLWRGKNKPATDTTNLLYAFKSGQIHGHFRYFFMGTDNAPKLSDYYANALGGGLKYETAPFKGFQYGLSGFYVYNMGSSNFTNTDATTNVSNRYEVALFDITDPSNKNNIDRLEELYLKYSWQKGQITLGKQLINTPFINLQDGRMRPTEVGGVYTSLAQTKKLKLEGGYLYQISPRSTVEWYRVAASIGIAAQGVNIDGSKGNYKGNLSSKGIALLGGEYSLNKQLKASFYEMYVDNIFNTWLLQLNYSKKLDGGNRLIVAGQCIGQNALNNGGNPDQTKTYFGQNNKATTFGFKTGIENKRWQTSLNYNRITAQGRYLMPREWGRDPFFTFLPRERNEGLGDVSAYMAKVTYGMPKVHSKAQFAMGYYSLPSVNNVELNKYGMPSYTQLNLDLRHDFEGFYKGLDAQLLLVRKLNQDETIKSQKYMINKVDMNNVNLVLNYHF